MWSEDVDREALRLAAPEECGATVSASSRLRIVGVTGSRRRGGGGEPESYRGALAEGTVGPDVAAHALHQVPDDGQAEAGPALGAGSSGVDTVEALEDAGEGIPR